MKGYASAGKRRWYLVVLTVLLILAGICAGVFFASYNRWIHLPTELQTQIDLLPDIHAQVGTPNGEGVEEPLETGSFQVVINRLPTVQAGERACTIWAENPDTNPNDLRVSLYLDETGELLGMTHRIARGMRVDELELSRELPVGEYPVTALLEMLDDEQNPAGQLSLSLTLRVLGNVS